jgi:hypothetical protein
VKNPRKLMKKNKDVDNGVLHNDSENKTQHFLALPTMRKRRQT